jgi:hypothetical protein
MRTYDKLIATICTGQGNGGLLPPFGSQIVMTVVAATAITVEQDSD